ncbi:MAG TPA: hypothetical protein VGL73_08145 [Caulobacteraceae bacterium]
MDRSLSEKAAEALKQALATSSRHDRALLMEEALSLHRRAVEAKDEKQAGGGPIASAD